MKMRLSNGRLEKREQKKQDLKNKRGAKDVQDSPGRFLAVCAAMNASFQGSDVLKKRGGSCTQQTSDGYRLSG